MRGYEGGEDRVLRGGHKQQANDQSMQVGGGKVNMVLRDRTWCSSVARLEREAVKDSGHVCDLVRSRLERRRFWGRSAQYGRRTWWRMRDVERVRGRERSIRRRARAAGVLWWRRWTSSSRGAVGRRCAGSGRRRRSEKVGVGRKWWRVSERARRRGSLWARRDERHGPLPALRRPNRRLERRTGRERDAFGDGVEGDARRKWGRAARGRRDDGAGVEH